jgi:RNA polymerase sigma-70 factor, ECF subfamily
VIDDAPLIDRTLRGDSIAFGELVEKYQHRLFQAIVHVVGAREDAEDVVQESFVQAYFKLKSFQRKSAFFTWLYRIAFNLAMTWRRKQKPKLSLDAAHDDQGLEVTDLSPTADQQLLQAERATLVQAALQELLEEHRAILVLREIEGLEYETIAEILGIPGGTVRSRLHRARLQLREILKTKLESSTN